MNNAIGSSSFGNRLSADTVCAHCEGLGEHEAWCRTREPRVQYAFQIVVDPSKLTLADTLVLHSLGVAWTNTSAQTPGSCPGETGLLTAIRSVCLPSGCGLGEDIHGANWQTKE